MNKTQSQYTCTTEETHFNGGGYRAKIVRNNDGGTSYLGGAVFKTAEEAKLEATLIFSGAKPGFHY